MLDPFNSSLCHLGDSFLQGQARMTSFLGLAHQFSLSARQADAENGATVWAATIPERAE
jgi:hypothetical protein